MLDPRLKLQYYKDHHCEDKFIQSARKQVTDLWNFSYKVNTIEVEKSANDIDIDLFGHIFKKQKVEKDELSIYLDEKILPGKTDILAWWKVF